MLRGVSVTLSVLFHGQHSRHWPSHATLRKHQHKCHDCLIWSGATFNVQVPLDLALDGIGATYEQTLDFSDRYSPMQRHHQSLPLNGLQVSAVSPSFTGMHELRSRYTIVCNELHLHVLCFDLNVPPWSSINQTIS